MVTIRFALRIALPGLALLAGCAATRPATVSPGSALIAFPPQPVEVTPGDLELARKNDDELLAIGQAAFAAGEFEQAAAAFDRLVDLRPGSSHMAVALSRGGVAHQRLDQWSLALERFRSLEARSSGAEALEASFKIAECYYQLEELPAAAAVLSRLVARVDLPPDARVRALTQLGVVELAGAQLEASEQHLRQAISVWKSDSEQERLDRYHPSQAQFYLGEVMRARFLGVTLDPSRGGEQALARDLEAKASLLLSAQDQYLLTIRMGHGDWSVAAGYRIGELYDALHAALVEAPCPPGLDAGQIEAYRAELKQRVRVLIVKAIAIYEQTLAVAGRAGAEDNPFVAETQDSLDRMKQALDDLPAPEPPAEPEPVPAGPGPDRR